MTLKIFINRLFLVTFIWYSTWDIYGRYLKTGHLFLAIFATIAGLLGLVMTATIMASPKNTELK